MFVELLTITQVSFGINYFAQNDNTVLNSLVFKFTENKNFQNKLKEANEWLEIEMVTKINMLNKGTVAIDILNEEIKLIITKIKEIEKNKQELDISIINLKLSFKQFFLYTTIYSILLMFLGSIEYKLFHLVNSKYYLSYFYLFIFIFYISYYIYQIFFLIKLKDIKRLYGKSKFFYSNIRSYIYIISGFSILLLILNYCLFNSTILLPYKELTIFIFSICIILSLFIAYIYVYFKLFKFNITENKKLDIKIDELGVLRDDVEKLFNKVLIKLKGQQGNTAT